MYVCKCRLGGHETKQRDPEGSGEISWRENKGIYVVESRRGYLGREKESVRGSRVTGRRAGEKDMSEQTIMACIDENTIMDSISLSTNLENNEREAEEIREFSRKYRTTQRNWS